MRGTKLGNPNGAQALRRAGKGNAAAIQANKDAAQEHAARLAPVVKALRAEGVATLAGIAAELNTRGMRTPRGATWHPSGVRNLLARLPAQQVTI